ncbi:N-acetyltransferase [Candidatus Bathyarchaeota archaeon]|nr:N-acetyltransferase [Candidatus Bathyarchaeota archaeon]
MLKGKSVNLVVLEKEDMQSSIAEWNNNSKFYGEYAPIAQFSQTEMEKLFENTENKKWFIIEKKDESKIGFIGYFPKDDCLEIGYALLPSERKKGYCTEAVKIIVDFLFLSRDIVRIQAYTDVGNVVSHMVLNKANFKKEGVLRKFRFIRGEWKDYAVFSILREEWKQPRIMTKST